jgi:hypothetical protein
MAKGLNASVHMPRIGTGQAGGSWPVVEEIISETLTKVGIKVLVYDLPQGREKAKAQPDLAFTTWGGGMPKLIVLISGSVSAGKTTLSEGLRRQYAATTVKTKEVLKDLAVKKLKRELPSERKALQQFGEQVDVETSGEWVLNALKKHITDARVGQEDVVVVDAVRILPQIKAIRRSYQFAVKHIHLEASPPALAKRTTLAAMPAWKSSRSIQMWRRTPQNPV